MSDKTVLITGSSKGLGRSLALVFASNKFNIILHGRNQEDLEKIKRIILENDVNCDIVRGDITLQETLDSLYEIAHKRNIDVLINNAGIYASKPFQDMGSEEFRKIIEVNLIAPVQLIKKVFPIFIKEKSGVIININSIAGKNPNELESAYCASKYGLRGFTQAFQIEANKHNVRLVDVYFGAMNTPITKGRKDFQKLINTDDAAKSIYELCKDYPSMRINEIEIRRKDY